MTIKIYRSYSFKDKDPIIDILRTVLGDEGIDYHDLEEFSGVSTSTYYSWFEGVTKRPSFPCIMATVRILPTTAQRAIWKRLTVEGIRHWQSAETQLKRAA